ncbi:MAM and LDL-receptor class A domain-containing protein 1-like, partial [Limulus polyphemus]|uniref:MAM and LDL-receptor class A domain-containing protein 1-like n=1 Tax=Limulus polyphemus TaxID=6850 RepID=A0ABM1RYJ2_LIMPO
HRNKRQEIDFVDEVPPPVVDNPEDSCDFGNGLLLKLCTWSNPLNTPSSLRWKTGRGVTSNWFGGPRTDHTSANADGGYAFFETSYRETDDQREQFPNGQTSQFQNSERRTTALLVSQNMSQTDPSGFCVSFFYAINGLSAQSLKMLLIDGETLEKRTLWESTDGLEGSWRKGEVGYTYEKTHQVEIMIEGVPKNHSDPSRIFRGYIALDDIRFESLSGGASNCLGKCRSLLKFFNINYSSDNNPICMTFATHMFGNGIGTLRILKRSQGTNEISTIWEISGPSGNRWYEARVPVSSPKPFQLIFEATVGKNYLGDIAIDNIAFRPGTCPIFPQTASPTSGNCLKCSLLCPS